MHEYKPKLLPMTLRSVSRLRRQPLSQPSSLNTDTIRSHHTLLFASNIVSPPSLIITRLHYSMYFRLQIYAVSILVNQTTSFPKSRRPSSLTGLPMQWRIGHPPAYSVQYGNRTSDSTQAAYTTSFMEILPICTSIAAIILFIPHNLRFHCLFPQIHRLLCLPLPSFSSQLEYLVGINPGSRTSNSWVNGQD